MENWYAVLTCAILTGVLPPNVDGLDTENFAEDSMANAGLTHTGMNGVNGTTAQKIESGAIVAIVFGSISLFILLVGVLSRQCTMRYQPVGIQPVQMVVDPAFFNVGQSAECEQDMPLLRLSTNTDFAK